MKSNAPILVFTLLILLLVPINATAAPPSYSTPPTLPGHELETQKDCSYVTMRCPTGGTYRLDTCWDWWSLSCYICENNTAAILSKCEIPTCDESYIAQINGCSGPDINSTLEGLFGRACAVHDLCYYTLGRSKGECDDDFFYNMERLCGIPGLTLAGYPNCTVAAGIVYAAVALTDQAQDAYDSDQQWAAAHCSPVNYDGPLYVDGNADGLRWGSSWEHAFTDLQSALAVAEAGDEIWLAYGTYHTDPRLTSGLVAFWDFDQDFTATIGGTSYNGTPMNGTTEDMIVDTGRFGGAAYFQRAQSQYVDVDAPVLQGNRDHSYSVWYKATWSSIAEGPRYFLLETRPNYSASYGLENLDGDSKDTLGEVYTQWDGGSASKHFDHGTGENAWNNVVVTYSAALSRQTIYRNGTLVGTLNSWSPLEDTAGLVIGGHRDGTGRNWDGWIDEVAFWNRVLTANDIASIQSHSILDAPGDRGSSFVMKSGVSIYGGFAGMETDRTSRDWEANPVVLSGDLGVLGDNSDNAFNVVKAVGVDATAFLSGVTIEDGNADGTSSVRNGGGIYIDSASPTFDHLVVQRCTADYRGGGIYSEASNPTMSDVALLDNSAYNGGGMANYNSSGMVVAIRFEGNSSEYHGGGLENYQSSSPDISGAYFIGNSSRYGGALYCGSGSNPTLDLVSFEDNIASSFGGAIYNNAGSPVLDRVLFTGNDGGAGGGAIFNDSNLGPSNPVISNVVFRGNTAYHGGAIFTSNAGSSALSNAFFFENSGTFGSAIKLDTAHVELVNVTFLGNTGSAALYTIDSSTATIVNSILWGDTDGECYVDNSVLSVSHSLVQGCGGSGIGWDSALGSDLGGNLDLAPQFMDIPSGDAHLTPGSPAIDAGDSEWPGLPETDLDKNVRVSGAGVDMGAYELDLVTDVQEIPNIHSASLGVHPNPFNPSTTVTYRITTPGIVSLKIYDLKGRLVDTLVDGEYREKNLYEIQYRSSLASGVYLARLSTSGEFLIKKMVLLK